MTVQYPQLQQSSIRIGVEDHTGGGNIIEINLEYINALQIQSIIYSLENMLHRFKHTAVPYYTIINDTVNDINNDMDRVEGNTVVCRLGANLIQPHGDALVDQIISSLDEQTMDITMDMEIPLHAIDSPVLEPFMQRVNYRYIFSFGIQSTIHPNWNQILLDLELIM